MTILIFVIILGVLVLVHEIGHFIFAKKGGVHVEEFGIGYPPRAFTIGEKWGTRFSINWIPFGGFVKILGENYDQEVRGSDLKTESKESKDFSNTPSSKPQDSRFTQVSRKWQALILFGGVLFNILFAWFLFTVGFLIGIPSSVENDFNAEIINPQLTVVSVLPDSPAFIAGIKSGDKILKIGLREDSLVDVKDSAFVSEVVNDSKDKVFIELSRGSDNIVKEVLPDDQTFTDKKIIGISMDMVGTITLPLHKSIYEGFRVTYRMVYYTTIGLSELVLDAFKGEADMNQVTGPVGIVGLVGDASRLGFSYLITFTALISINLAIINMIPFPALDGGRLLFVAIEGITKKPINPKFAMVANTVGFGILILLMLVVTYRDIVKLF